MLLLIALKPSSSNKDELEHTSNWSNSSMDFPRSLILSSIKHSLQLGIVALYYLLGTFFKSLDLWIEAKVFKLVLWIVPESRTVFAKPLFAKFLIDSQPKTIHIQKLTASVYISKNKACYQVESRTVRKFTIISTSYLDQFGSSQNWRFWNWVTYETCYTSRFA